MESSRPEAEERLRRSLALSALAEAEGLKVEDGDIDAKVKELKKQLAGQGDIDPQRLRDAVIDDLLREKLLGWLEDNSTVTEKAPEADDTKPAKKPTAKKAATKKSGETKAKSTKAKADKSSEDAKA